MTLKDITSVCLAPAQPTERLALPQPMEIFAVSGGPGTVQARWRWDMVFARNKTARFDIAICDT